MVQEHQFPIVLIAGQTAVGKTEVSIKLARLINAEIISADSMQVYRGMDIGTAKPTLQERTAVRHHLIDVLDITEPFDASKFIKLTQQCIDDIKQRSKNIIICGGTGFYFKALLKGIGNAPPSDKILRQELEKIPLEILLKELQDRDPETFHNIDKKNPRRVIRAIEVIRLSGKPFSSLKSKWDDANGLPENYRFFGLKRETRDLRERIDARVDKMFESGLVEETRRLLELGLEKNPTAMQAIGYRQVVEYLKGIRSLEDTIKIVKLRTWQFARRQMTWFKKQQGIEWVNISRDSPVELIANEIFNRLRKGHTK